MGKKATRSCLSANSLFNSGIMLVKFFEFSNSYSCKSSRRLPTDFASVTWPDGTPWYYAHIQGNFNATHISPCNELQQLSPEYNWHQSNLEKMDVAEKRKIISVVSKCFDRFFTCETLEDALVNFRAVIEAAGIGSDTYGDPLRFYPRLKVRAGIVSNWRTPKFLRILIS